MELTYTQEQSTTIALIDVWSINSLKLGGNYLELSGNNKNDDKSLVILCQP